MAWYAKIQNNVVVEVTYAPDKNDSDWLYREFGGVWLKCKEDGSLRNLFPTIGFTYNENEDSFYPPKPFESWNFDRVEKRWTAPVSCPQDTNRYKWDESTTSWVRP